MIYNVLQVYRIYNVLQVYRIYNVLQVYKSYSIFVIHDFSFTVYLGIEQKLNF